MKLWLNAILIIMSGTISQANMGKYCQQAKEFGQSLKHEKPSEASEVPGYEGDKVPETKLKAHDLAESSQKAAQESKEAQFVEESLEKRQPYKIDVNDTLLTNADKIINDPEGNLKVSSKTSDQEIQKSIHTCEEGKPEVGRSCTSDLVANKVGEREEIKNYTVHVSVGEILRHPDPLVRDLLFDTSLRGYLGLFYKKKKVGKISYRKLNESETTESFKKIFKGSDASTGEKLSFTTDQIKQAKRIKLAGKTTRVKKHFHLVSFVQFEVQAVFKIPEYQTEWKTNCDELEELVDDGKCEYLSKQCTEGKETRNFDGVEITEDCWQVKQFYTCQGNSKNTCTKLRQQGCYQTSSKCIEETDGVCQTWEYTFDCVGEQGLEKVTIEGDAPYCLDGECVDQSWAPNQDMADSLSKLAIFQHIQKDMDPKAQTVFKGKSLKCSRHTASFKDCCVKDGWGLKVGLAGCKAEEKELAEQRKLDKCVRVGTYCAEKLLGKCLRKKTSYCCFASKLARIIHEQGRQRLGLKFGSGEHTKCQGLTLEQITKIDFSKIDLSELFDELLSKTKAPIMSKITKGIQESFEDKSRTISQENKIQGRDHDQF
jgi:type-F conjugative transfer system mating-pair stabilization protein TraN